LDLVKTSDFDYDLPAKYIAQTPLEPRDSARLLVLDRATGAVKHDTFRNLTNYLLPTDTLVLNETRVIPARLYARKVPSAGFIEILLLRRVDLLTWETMVGGKGLTLGKRLQVQNGPEAEIIEVLSGPRRLVRFEEPIEPLFDQVGHVPLPPYIHMPLNDPERYQTVYAQMMGSVAAPTAGLHFTNALIDRLRLQGITIARVILHVGLDTFAPVTEENPTDHVIHTEWCQVSHETVRTVRQTKQAGGRIIAVGTTSVRTLESAARRSAPEEIITPFEGPTDLYILPGYQFQVVDAMITNFHLPRSTLLMLVSAFAGRERVLETYEEAKRDQYRFYSFGDAMLIL
jgi:S-adenosylmethionine:tRNA ribosyltransferase-isomerase